MELKPSTITTTSILIITLFLSFLFSTDAKFRLDRSDHQAVLTVQLSLGIRLVDESQRRHPCTVAGVSCQRRVVSDSLDVLRVTHLRFESMGLDGFLHPAIGKLTELKELRLANNHLVDRLPDEIVDCTKLEFVELRNNRFTGGVTPELSLLTNLRVLDLSRNKFSGNLTFLKHLVNLEHLSLTDNGFSGKVPDSVRSFRNLQTFDVSRNPFLTGAVDIKSLKTSVDVSRRAMLVEGPVSYESGGNLVSAPAYAPVADRGFNSSEAPAPVAAGNGKRKKKKTVSKLVMALGFFAGAIAGGVSGLILSVVFKLLLALARGKNKTGPTIFSPNVIKRQKDLLFLENDDGLASLKIIGKGGCGEVYKKELPGSDGLVLAIKKIIQPPVDATELTEEDTKLLGKKMRQIRSEILTVGKIRHRNLLPLLAHMPRPNCHYLVYEFMKNGSLQDMLADVTIGKKQLDWPTRYRIAVGVSHGLEYLHFGQNPMIIHRDMKPANILLDDDMEAKIADFGLAKTMPDAHTHVTSSNVAGTLGYIAPEYHQTLKFTDKCDVYSFGVVLGVLVMGKLPSDEFFQNTSEMNMIVWMRNVMTSDNPNQAIDPKLLGNDYEDEMLLVLKIACFCTLEDPKQRPDSKNVRLMLSQIKH